MECTMDWPLCVGTLKLTGLESQDLNNPFLLSDFPLKGKKISTGQSCTVVYNYNKLPHSSLTICHFTIPPQALKMQGDN